ncbi:MAG TPA: MbnP family protein [Bacteroidia bacterium]|nr:MbnP family protein [Bacteroidia bacterium]
MRFCLLVLMLGWNLLFGQGGGVAVRFELSFGGVPLELGKPYVLPNGAPVVVEALRFYVSDLQLLDGEKVAGSAESRFLLVDAENAASRKVAVPLKGGAAFDRIRFNLGIDSLTQVSGAMGGVLDPTTGMYWAWQSGYIHFKLEGNAAHCPARNHVFQFHLGGYLPPFAALQSVELPIGREAGEMVIDLPIDRFLEGIDLGVTYEVMRPCEAAVGLSGKVADSFRVVE